MILPDPGFVVVVSLSPDKVPPIPGWVGALPHACMAAGACRRVSSAFVLGQLKAVYRWRKGHYDMEPYWSALDAAFSSASEAEAVDMARGRAARRIQRWWRLVVADPGFLACARRLRREFGELQATTH